MEQAPGMRFSYYNIFGIAYIVLAMNCSVNSVSKSKCFDKVLCRAAMLTKKKASSPINLNTSDDKISKSALLLSPVLISCKSNWNVSNM